jgi:polyketide synthase PksJ
VKSNAVAIVGIAGRFPGAVDIPSFWRLLRNGEEGITFFSRQELLEAGVSESLLDETNFVAARGVVRDYDRFDAPFFNISAGEAAQLDPQQRIFLECAWQAIEDAGYTLESIGARAAVFGGSGANTYLLQHLAESAPNAAGVLPFLLANEKDYLATRTAYKLNLKRAAISVQTACSTSLVAVHLACQNLLNGECDSALAGGVTIRVPQLTGYKYQEQGIFSPDGHCRPFDARAGGTVDSSGCGVVMLKRLEDALGDGDNIRAVILGSAINNDGSTKAGFTAPSVEGQIEVIAEAQAMAQASPESVTFVEGHGTATILGDPIECEALTRAFRAGTAKRQFCALGSVKSNVGHTDAAAGVAGLIKTVLALENGVVPATLHFTRPNPHINFGDSPFFVNSQPWKWGSQQPRRAGVSSFGVGGTNVHVVLEEAPPRERYPSAARRHFLFLSARSEAALDRMSRNLADHLEAHPELHLPDVAFTLRKGRECFEQTRLLECNDAADAIRKLREPQEQGAKPELCAADVAPGRRVSLPPYSFERRRYWLDPKKTQAAQRSSNIDTWFHTPIWKRSFPAGRVRNGTGSCLIFADGAGIGSLVAAEYEKAGCEVTIVTAGKDYRRISDREIVIDAFERRHYERLLTDMSRMPAQVIHSWSVGGNTDIAFGLRSLVSLAKAAGARAGQRPLDIAVVTSGVLKVAAEKSLFPENAAVLGAVKVIPQEYPHIRCRLIDLDHDEAQRDRAGTTEQLLLEMGLANPSAEVALRDGERWERAYVPNPLSRNRRCATPGGLYLITGGAGAIGMAFAECLAETPGVNLVLSGRSSESARAGDLERLRGLGADVHYQCADVTDRGRMEKLFHWIEQRWKRLDGVIHCAGVPGGGLIQGRDWEAMQTVLAPKMEGARLLAELLGNRPLDFFLLCSSMTAIRGGVGQIDYCAANAFLDAFAQAMPRRWRPVAVNWDAWSGFGMAAGRGMTQTPLAVRHPLLESERSDARGDRVFESSFALTKQWELNEHRVSSTGVLPGAAFVEMALAAFGQSGHGPCRLEAMSYLGLLFVNEGDVAHVSTSLSTEGRRATFRIREFVPGLANQRELARGAITGLPVKERARRPLPAFEGEPSTLPAPPLPVYLGPHWQCDLAVTFEGNSGAALIEIKSEFAEELHHYRLHPAMLDVATGFAIEHFGGGLYLPMYFESLTVYGSRLTRRIVSHAVLKSRTRDTLVFDVVITDADGFELVDVTGYTVRRVTVEELSRKVEPRPIAPGAGISPQEGKEACRRILAAVEVRQISVTPYPLDIHEYLTETPASTGSNVQDSPFEMLTAAWRKVLGVASVGPSDDFFELGGDSIVALQIIAELNEAGLHLSPGDFFEHPTIAGLATIVKRKDGLTDSVSSRGTPPIAAATVDDFPFAQLSPDELTGIMEKFEEQ